MLFVVQTAIYAPTAAGVRALRGAMQSKKLATQPPLCDAIPWSRTDDLALIGPAIGAPAAVLACEPFLKAGCRNLVLFGVCGGLSFESSTVEIGDIIVPTEAIDDNETRMKLENSFAALQIGKPCPVWTTHLPRKESEHAETFYRQGARAVDMELTAIAQLAAEYEANLSACFVVSDLNGQKNARGFKSKTVISALQTAAKIIMTHLTAEDAGPADRHAQL